ncbi:hypothetical protein OHD16_06880 [Sphingobacterium sp. ML3W]|uniref:hypothetical protein n=1 Tax=Sphingobacterium sp. ML3W TaxID=1538644 RepID=UPI00249AD042|nr:hypothetical protein [Sphingobacterium sp. ML3W]WFA79694.1 hypothetical protein OGI71_00020 [Sphingobacterium sp. ML3W]
MQRRCVVGVTISKERRLPYPSLKSKYENFLKSHWTSLSGTGYYEINISKKILFANIQGAKVGK